MLALWHGWGCHSDANPVALFARPAPPAPAPAYFPSVLHSAPHRARRLRHLIYERIFHFRFGWGEQERAGEGEAGGTSGGAGEEEGGIW